MGMAEVASIDSLYFIKRTGRITDNSQTRSRRSLGNILIVDDDSAFAAK